MKAQFLPPDVARCDGNVAWREWPLLPTGMAPEASQCRHCLRRITYRPEVGALFISPATELPCPQRIDPE